jgi:predicted metalloprotease
MRRVRDPGRRRVSVLVVATGLVLSACGADGGVTSLSAEPSPPRSQGEIAATPPRTPPTTEPTATEPATTEPTATEPATTDTTEPPPVIAEAQLLVDIPFTDVVDADDSKPPRAHDAFVAVAFSDVERWWADVYPQVYGGTFEPLSGGVYAGYPERQTPVPGCGEPRTDYVDLQVYVAFYCPEGDFMAYDDGDGEGELGPSILTPLADAYGASVVGVVLAHEYGHAIQARIGALDRRLATVVTEQQADCFAGAWTGQAYRGESPLLRLGDSDVRAGLLAMLEVRDPVGTNQFVPGGHGSAFDRVGAFQEGFLAGPGRCAELLDDPLPLMPNEFQTDADAFFAGNAPYDCDELDPRVVGQDFIDQCTPAPVFLAEDLDDFWDEALGGDWSPVRVQAVDDLSSLPVGACSDPLVLAPEVAVCPVERRVVYDEPEVRSLYGEFGDFTLGYFYGIAWAELAQRAIESPLTGEPRALLNDCLTGAWVRDITPDRFGNTPRQADGDGDGEPDSTVTSSPGDLDEAIQMAILVGDLGADVDVVGTPFEKIGAFRTGVLGGLDACTDLV